MDSNTKKNLIVGGLVTTGVVVIVILAMSYKPSTSTTPGNTSTQTGGLANLLSNIFNPFKNLFSNTNKTCVGGCDTFKKGYDCNGFPDVKCGFGG